MKKTILLALAMLLLLAACTDKKAGATEPPTSIVFATPDARAATPEVGAAIVSNIPGVKTVRLNSQPDSKSASVGSVIPGAQGQLLGLDASGSWALVQFESATGWLPVQLLELTIAQ